MGKQKRMRIMFVSAANNIHTVRWVNSLVQSGHDVDLIYLPNHKPSQDKIDNRVNLYPLLIGGIFGYYLNFIQIRSIFRKTRPDVVNAHFATGYGTLVRLASIRPVVLSVWGSDIYSFPHKSLFHKYILKQNLLFADIITSSSECMASEISVLFPQLTDLKYEIVPFGVDMKQFNSNRHPRIPKLDPTCFTIGTIKTLRHNYNIETIIEAASILCMDKAVTDKLNLKFDIYGTGPLRDSLQDMITALKLEGKVELKGSIPNTDAPTALSKMDIFCVTSAHESFGVAVVEAMAMGVPVVATDVDGFREVLGKYGLLAPVRNPAAIADHILRFVNDTHYRKKKSVGAKLRARRLYDWNNNVQSMINLYDRTSMKFKIEKKNG